MKKKKKGVGLIRSHLCSFNSHVSCLTWSHCPVHCRALFSLQFLLLVKDNFDLTLTTFNLSLKLSISFQNVKKPVVR